MSIELLGSVVEQIFFWSGVVFGVLSFLYLLAVEVNRRGVFQAPHGKRSFQSDISVGTAMITTVLSVISITASLKAIYVLYGIIASILFILILVFIDEAYWRAFKKAIVSRFSDLWNRIEAITEGKNRKT